ncbi:MAG: sugar phosphate isomerase/epimerase [Spirochaetales bacterium]|nr:sugar phosphate isomerase/epimerase [Spirochaetales bacterium]
MEDIKGPAIFLAQFLRDEAPFNNLENITNWAKSLGYKGVQIPANEKSLIDIDIAAESKDYCDELRGKCNNLEITELATHLFGQLIAVHPAYDELFDVFTEPEYRNNSTDRQKWAVQKMQKSIKASANLGLKVLPTFSGALMWHLMYPWPQRPAGLVEQGFKELAKLWQPVLNTAEDYEIDLAYEIHPGEDLHDGITFERFLHATGNHNRVKILYDPSHFILQCLDYIEYIKIYAPYIKAFHVKDAEFNPSGKTGVYGGYSPWLERAGRFRSLGDGQVDFQKVFTTLSENNFNSWAVMEWECCIKDSEQGAREGAPFINSMIIQTAKRAFDDFAGGESDENKNRRILGLQ